jgi:hypothetical protein
MASGKRPEWVLETPTLIHQLAIFNSEAEPVQEIELSRDEYLALKRYLAEMRGYLAGDSAGRSTEPNHGPLRLECRAPGAAHRVI